MYKLNQCQDIELFSTIKNWDQISKFFFFSRSLFGLLCLCQLCFAVVNYTTALLLHIISDAISCSEVKYSMVVICIDAHYTQYCSRRSVSGWSQGLKWSSRQSFSSTCWPERIHQPLQNVRPVLKIKVCSCLHPIARDSLYLCSAAVRAYNIYLCRPDARIVYISLTSVISRTATKMKNKCKEKSEALWRVGWCTAAVVSLLWMMVKIMPWILVCCLVGKCLTVVSCHLLICM